MYYFFSMIIMAMLELFLGNKPFYCFCVNLFNKTVLSLVSKESSRGQVFNCKYVRKLNEEFKIKVEKAQVSGNSNVKIHGKMLNQQVNF